MGIYDRDYQRDQYGRPPGIHLGGSRTLTTDLVLITCGVYLAQLLFDRSFTELLSLHANWFTQPWRLFELLTYGFLHSPDDLKHIIFNMLGLWIFGRAVEARFGRGEFLLFYLAAIIFAGLCWNVSAVISGGVEVQTPAGLVTIVQELMGASGGVAAVLILFALCFPHQTILIWGVMPIPAWLGAVIFVGLDLMGAMGRGQSNVAYTAHLGGAFFAFIYFRFGWRISTWLPTKLSVPKLRRKPPLRVHNPKSARGDDDDSDSEVDQILRKIQRQGQDSLTSHERRILERASREYQRRRQ